MLILSCRSVTGRRRSGRRGPFLLAALCFFCLAALPALAAVSADEARQCVLEAGRAVDGADAVAFERLVDVDGILEQALDIVVRRARQPATAAQLPPVLALLFSQAAQREGSVRALLLNETRAFVLNGVASGAFAGRSASGASAQGLLAPLFADASLGRKEVRQVGQPQRKGQDWLVPFVVRDGGNGESYAVTGRVAAAAGGVRLVAVENLEALIARLAEEGADAGSR